MSYIGRQNLGGAYRQLDDISSGFDGSDTTHTMQVNSANVTVGDVNQIILSLGGVIQKPGTDFTVSGSVLTFTTAPAANTSFFAVLLGSDNGGTVTPTDASVTTAKLSGNLVTPGTLDVNGQELILDADADASITADTDDQIDIKVGGTDVVKITAATLDVTGPGNTGGIININNTDTAGASTDNIGRINFVGSDGSSSASGTRAAIETEVTGNFGSTQLNLEIASGGAAASKIATFSPTGFQLDGGKISTFGESAPDASDGGITLQQGSNDDKILTLKSSDVAHGVTDDYETDTYAQFKKYSATEGGLRIEAITEASIALMPRAVYTTGDTGKGTGATAPIFTDARKKSGTGLANPASNENIFAVTAGFSVKFIVDAEGELHSDGGAQSAYDTYEDAHLVRAYDLSHGKGVIDSKFDKFISYNHEKLADMKLVGREPDGTPNHFINVTGMQRLHNGAIWQQYEKHEKLANAMYELAKAAVGEDKANEILEQNDIKLLK